MVKIGDIFPKTNLNGAPCPIFQPTIADPAMCYCQGHWRVHSDDAKTKWGKAASPSMRQLVASACLRDINNPCTTYYPSRAYSKGEIRPDCTCGRPSRSHKVSEIIAGSKKFDEDQADKLKEHSYVWDAQKPGECVICGKEWHSHSKRPRVIEQFEDAHHVWCKCVAMNGDFACSCMSDSEIQDKLDEIGKKEKTVSCKRFRSKSPGNTTCGSCGTAFYGHAQSARQGKQYFHDWRKENMTNGELATWFLKLGRDRSERIQVLRSIVTDPNFRHVTQASLEAPSIPIAGAVLEAITGEHILHSVREKRNLVHEVMAELTVTYFKCPTCGEETSKEDGKICEGCGEFFSSHGASGQNPEARLTHQGPAAQGESDPVAKKES